MHQDDIDYFARGRDENPLFWSRIGGRPDFTGAVVVDLGCGHGSLCADIAASGARRVIGLDLSAKRIAFATENVAANRPELKDRIEFRVQTLGEMPEREIDYFVSKDAFEHILGLERVLDEMRDRLRAGGRIYAGFGPLWNSPFGDHGRTGLRIPWAHAVLPERTVIRWSDRHYGSTVTSIEDLGLNALSLADYERIFAASGMDIVSMRVNSSDRLASRVFSGLARIPGLREYFSHNIYCILEKTPSSDLQ